MSVQARLQKIDRLQCSVDYFVCNCLLTAYVDWRHNHLVGEIGKLRPCSLNLLAYIYRYLITSELAVGEGVT